jgi:hypothetical protein
MAKFRTDFPDKARWSPLLHTRQVCQSLTQKQLIERFQNTHTFDLHVSAPHSVQFRNSLQPFIGAPYDERLYTTHP